MRGDNCAACGKWAPEGDWLAGRWLCPGCGTTREQGIKDAVRVLRNAARRKHNRDIKEGLLAAARMVWWMDNEEADHG